MKVLIVKTVWILPLIFILSLMGCMDNKFNIKTTDKTSNISSTDNNSNDTTHGTTSTLDGFTVSPTVSLNAINNFLYIRPTVSNSEEIADIKFYLNNSLSFTKTDAPFEWEWDTLATTNGTYTLKIVLTNKNSSTHEITQSVTVNNPTNIPENLVELFKRKQRKDQASWNPSSLENPTSFIWQPETFVYFDSISGHEVWKMTNTPKIDNFYHNDIGVTPWSADGKRMAIASQRATQAFSNSDGRIWMTVNTNGKNFRPTVEGASRWYNSINGYFHWCPQRPDTYYEVTYGWPNDPNKLNKTVVTDSSVSTSTILTYPESIKIDKMISADGKKLLISSYDENKVYPTTVYPNPNIDDSDGYSIDRNLGLYGTTPSTYTTAHDRYYAGTGDWYFIMPIGGAHRAWWKLKTIGSAADGGARYDNSDFPVTNSNYDFAEAWPVNADSGNNPDPFLSGYWSHFVPDRWGRYALHSSCCTALSWNDPLGIGPGVWDIDEKQYVVATFGGGASHHDWHGFTDWTVSSSNGDDTVRTILAQKFNDKYSQIVVNQSYAHADGGTSYETNPRPAQSPDGTKVAWHGEFLNGQNAVDSFWSVVHYPAPPTNLGAILSQTAGKLDISFLPPKYTSRTWINPNTNLIDEINGEVLFSREVKNYHLWRSNSLDQGWRLVNSSTANYLNDSVTNTLKPTYNQSWVTTQNKIKISDNLTNGTFFYALTTEEHSNLESRELSEIIQVTVSSNQVSSSTIALPKGKKLFWTTPPNVPSNFNVTKLSTAGQFRLSWNENSDSKIRYYNIYYSELGNPAAIQARKIASLPYGTQSFVDWLAHLSATVGHYGITAVDRQGNESEIYHSSSN